MNYFSIILIAIALGIDAFAVSLAGGSFFGKATARQRFRLSFHFGLFQFFMPIIGWFIGKEIVDLVKHFDHWVALIILSIIGIKMIFDGLKTDDVQFEQKDISKGLTLISLAFATSIDALAVGFSFGIVNSDIIIPCLIIGVTASVMSLIGIKLGEVLSVKFGSRFAIVGGVILILIGLNILNEHLNLL